LPVPEEVVDTIEKLSAYEGKHAGTHSHIPLHFVDVAINKTKGGRMFHHLGVHCFYVRAEEYADLFDSAFQPDLSDGGGC
jgi:hypothetical protein